VRCQPGRNREQPVTPPIMPRGLSDLPPECALGVHENRALSG
jgi:hypothetical protein